MKKKFYFMLLIACISIVGVKAQNYPGYEPCPPRVHCLGYVGIVATAYYNLQDAEFVFEANLKHDISYLSLPFASIYISGRYIRFTVSKADFKEYFINPAVKGQSYFDIGIDFAGGSSSPYWNSVGQHARGNIRLIFPPQP